jgi:hypothetical protein
MSYCLSNIMKWKHFLTMLGSQGVVLKMSNSTSEFRAKIQFGSLPRAIHYQVFYSSIWYFNINCISVWLNSPHCINKFVQKVPTSYVRYLLRLSRAKLRLNRDIRTPAYMGPFCFKNQHRPISVAWCFCLHTCIVEVLPSGLKENILKRTNGIS